MRVLIDHATLSGVQRLLGDVSVKNYDTVDADIACFENLAQSILLYDEIICIDDYIPLLRSSRKESLPFVRFLDENALPELRAIKSDSRILSESLRPQFVNGESNSPILDSVLSQLKSTIGCNWNFAGSAYYLTMEMVGNDFENSVQGLEFSKQMMRLLINSEYDLSTKNHTALADFYNNNVKSELNAKGQPSHLSFKDIKYGRLDFNGQFVAGSTQESEMLLASLNWLAYKSIYYTQMSEYLQTDLVLYPTRQVYQQNFLRDKQIVSDGVSKKIRTLLNEQLSHTVETVLDGENNCGAVSMNLPIFSAWAIKQGRTPQMALKALLEAREQPEFVSLREKLKVMHTLFEQGDIRGKNKLYNSLSKEIKRQSTQVVFKYGIPTAQGVLLSKVVKGYNSVANVFGILPKLPELDLGLNIQNPFQKNTIVGNIYRDITHDLATYPRMGKIRSDLIKSMNVEKPNMDGRYVHNKSARSVF